MANDWIEHVERHRSAKDEAFASDHRPPIPTDERSAFGGLDYLPGRWEISIHRSTSRARREAPRHGHNEHGRRAEISPRGEFRFEIDGEPATIQAYKADTGDGRFWVHLRDATSGVGTSGAGRYLDLGPTDHRTGEGEWILDFNEADNPTCSYSDRYECPLPPMENWLDVSIQAGEKTYRPRTRSMLTESTETSM